MDAWADYCAGVGHVIAQAACYTMLIIGSVSLFLFGMLLLSWQAIRVAFSLLKIAYYLIKGAVCLVVLVVCVVCLGVQYVMRWFKPDPPEPVPYFYNDEDVPTIELPRKSFYRVRG